MIVGLTGGIATGKSTVTGMFRGFGAYVVDADVWARQVVEPGQPALLEIADVFGPEVLLPDGTLNRPALGGVIFQDETLRQRLNDITHPRVREGMRAETEQFFAEHPDKPILWDVPLLFEGETQNYVDTTVLVYVDQALQLERLMQRDNLDRQAALARIHAQMPIDEKRQLADYVIDNSQSREETKEQVRSLWQTLQMRAKAGGKRSSTDGH